MPIWVDADSLPELVKEMLFKAAERKQQPLYLVANHSLQIPRSPCIRAVQVEHGFDVANQVY